MLLLILSGVAYFTSRPEQIEERLLTAEIPAEPGGSGSSRGRIEITIREAELHIEPVGPGEPLRVEGRYDVNAFALEGWLEPGTDANDAWVYEVSFGRAEGAGVFSGLVSLVRGSTSRIDVFLPTDVRFDLDLEMQEGGAVVRLAGLWLRNAEIDFESGAFELSVDEPLREPMERFSIRTARGGSLLNRLGNASPRRLDVSYRMGGIDMDLSGRWRGDAEIGISGDTGGGAVHLPRGVNLEGLARRGVERSGRSDPQVPTLRFSVSTGIGRLEFSD